MENLLRFYRDNLSFYTPLVNRKILYGESIAINYVNYLGYIYNTCVEFRSKRIHSYKIFSLLSDFFNDLLSEYEFKECPKSDITIGSIFMKIYGRGSHMNSFLIDDKNKTIERFEPNGILVDHEIDAVIEKYLNKKAEEIGYVYLSPITYTYIDIIKYIEGLKDTIHPIFSELELEIKTKRIGMNDISYLNGHGGMCLYLSLLYLEMRLKFRNLTRIDIVNEMYFCMINDPDMFWNILTIFSESVMYQYIKTLIQNYLEGPLSYNQKEKIIDYLITDEDNDFIYNYEVINPILNEKFNIDINEYIKILRETL